MGLNPQVDSPLMRSPGPPGHLLAAKTSEAVTEHAVFFQRFSTCFIFFQHAVYLFNMPFKFFSASVSTCWIQHDHFSTCFFIHWTCLSFLQQFQHAPGIHHHHFSTCLFFIPSRCLLFLPQQFEHVGFSISIFQLTWHAFLFYHCSWTSSSVLHYDANSRFATCLFSSHMLLWISTRMYCR
jgi:hypothetical protein